MTRAGVTVATARTAWRPAATACPRASRCRSWTTIRPGTRTGKPRQTWLNVVAADFDELVGLDKESGAPRDPDRARAIPRLRSEADRPGAQRLQLNDTQPLFTNSVGTWQYRPEPGLYRERDNERHKKIEFQNLGLAGDFCRSEVDIGCLEGAVLTARRAARAIAKKAGCEHLVDDPPSPAEVSQRKIETLKRDREPWLRLAVRGSLGARLDRREPDA